MALPILLPILTSPIHKIPSQRQKEADTTNQKHKHRILVQGLKREESREMPMSLAHKEARGLCAILAFMRKWANEWAKVCLGVFVASFFGAVALWASDFGSRHYRSVVIPAFILTALLLLCTAVGVTLGYRDVRQEERSKGKLW